MRRFRGIIESDIPPNDKEVIWINRGELMYNRNGKWTTIAANSTNELVVDWEDIQNKPDLVSIRSSDS